MTQYELIRANESLLRLMVANGILAKDVMMLQMADEAEKMEKDNEKRQFITNSLADKYGISPRSVYNILERLKQEVQV